MVRRLGWLTVLLWLMVLGNSFGQEIYGDGSLEIIYFWQDNCVVCESQAEFHKELLADYPSVKIVAYKYPNYTGTMRQIAADHGEQLWGLPMTFIGGEHWVGFNSAVREEILAFVAAEGTAVVQRSTALDVPILGRVDLADHSLIFSTAVISFVDGFNPCSIWVLSLLLALVANSGSRRKMLLVGITFLVVTASVYGLFIAGIFNILSVLPFEGLINWVVALLCIAFALVNIKDYFWYGKGVSLSIAAKHKPGIYKGMRGVISSEGSPLQTMALTAALAFGVSLAELPCTAGFPILWSGMVSGAGVGLWDFSLLLGLYILIYLSVEIFMFIGAAVTLRASKLHETQGRVLKLFGGMIMLAFGITLISAPGWMRQFNSSMIIVGVSFTAALLIFLLDRFVLGQHRKS